ncbi:hypothetical protein [Nocardia camponoti]|uniref:Uncharacterized protein n=1 Tax=Nocardia camponoti TaxID=1616106 RepID=A0A917QUG5_9NOCA|nr:hypothetical protein [Nocardia camponoti]GGK69078.1 hypothetical protein GCM10011591_46520 [Nocardia camponoti]
MEFETLEEWAQRHGRNLKAVRALAARPDFPAPKRPRPRSGSGTPWQEYDSAELDDWLDRWDAARRPEEVTVPDGTDLDEYRALGAIADLIGRARKTVSQYREHFDAHASYEDRGKRRFYRTGDIIDLLNARLGYGRALDPERDRRRHATSED